MKVVFEICVFVCFFPLGVLMKHMDGKCLFFTLYECVERVDGGEVSGNADIIISSRSLNVHCERSVHLLD